MEFTKDAHKLACLNGMMKGTKEIYEEYIEECKIEIEEAKKNISDVLFKAEQQAKQIVEDAKSKAIEERQEIDAQIEAEKEKLIDAKIELAMLKDKAKDIMTKFTDDITALG